MDSSEGSCLPDGPPLGVIEEGGDQNHHMPNFETRLLSSFFEHLNKLLVIDHPMVDVTATITLEVVVA